MVNFRFMASAVVSTEETVAALERIEQTETAD
jgi:hypothetical protein